MVIANASGCGAHMQSYEEPLPLLARFATCWHSSTTKGWRHALRSLPVNVPITTRHALRAQHPRGRALLSQIPDLRVLEAADGDDAAGAGIYVVTPAGNRR